MGDVHDQATEAGTGRVYSVIVGALYAGLIGANLYLVFDWWRDTEAGRSTIERVKAKAAGCSGCAKRKAALRGAVNRMHFQAQQIVEEAQATPAEAGEPEVES